MIFIKTEIVISRDDPRFDQFDPYLKASGWKVEEYTLSTKYTNTTDITPEEWREEE